MNNIKRSVIAILIVLFNLSLFAEQCDSVFTLEQCISLAIQNNRKGIEAKNNVEVAVTIKKEAFTKYFPEIAAAGMAFWGNHDILQYNLLDIVELGLIKRGKVAGIQALQPIFTGGLIINGNKLAGVAEEVAKIRKEQTENELRLNTENFFWKLNTLESSMKVIDSAIEFLDTLENQVKVMVDAGLITRNDLLKVQLKRNTYLSDKVDLQNGIQLVKMLLGQYMGLGVSGNFQIKSEIPENVPDLDYSLFLPSAQALGQTSDYQLLQKNIEAKKIEKRIEVGSNLPSVMLGGGWYYHDLLKQNHNFGSVQIAVSVPLTGWWSGSYAIKRRNLELINAQNEMQDLSEQLQIEMQDKWNNLTAAHRKMEIEKEGIDQSKENLYLNKMYYEAGMCTISDLLEAETSYKESEDRFTSAYGEFKTAQASYLIATGR
ncbi:MAG: TolC family protein [Muribaculaceae bacterium]|nr:TolC family protein [Muribaculaceae bacterium]